MTVPARMVAGARVLVRLKYVATSDFRRSEVSNYREIPPEIRNALRDGEAVCLKSHGGDQLVFVYRPRQLGADGPEVFCSVRLRLPPSRTWNPLMLGEYAREAGLELIGIRRLNEHLARRRGDEVSGEGGEP